MFYQDKPQVLKLAKGLTRALQGLNVEVTRSHLQESIAQALGFADFNAFAASRSVKGVNALLSSNEQRHLLDAQENSSYGREAVLQVQTGFYLVCPAYPAECDYIRVCDPYGREIAYWASDEWQQAPQEVMGAIMGAVCRAKPAELPEAAAKAEAIVSIAEVDFDTVSNVVIDGNPFVVAWREEAYLPYVGAQHLDAFEEKADHCAVLLNRMEDGLVFEEYLTVGLLTSLTWDSGALCFRDPEGVAYEFYVEQKFQAKAAPVAPRVLEVTKAFSLTELERLTANTHGSLKVALPVTLEVLSGDIDELNDYVSEQITGSAIGLLDIGYAAYHPANTSDTRFWLTVAAQVNFRDLED